MSQNITFSGTTYTLPGDDDINYGAGASGLIAYFVALAAKVLQLGGGAYSLTADLNLGTAFGVLARYFKPSFTDSSGTPGAATANTGCGLAKFAAGVSTCVITNNIVTANSVVVAVLQAIDGSLTNILRVTPAAGSFTVTANAASTGTSAKFCWAVFQ